MDSCCSNSGGRKNVTYATQPMSPNWQRSLPSERPKPTFRSEQARSVWVPQRAEPELASLPASLHSLYVFSFSFALHIDLGLCPCAHEWGNGGEITWFRCVFRSLLEYTACLLTITTANMLEYTACFRISSIHTKNTNRLTLTATIFHWNGIYIHSSWKDCFFLCHCQNLKVPFYLLQ